MTSSNAVSAEEFDRVAKLHCRRWEDRSLDVVRAILGHQEGVAAVAERFGMTRQQANVLRARFIERMEKTAAVKVAAEEFMQQVTPANALDTFKDDIRQLVKRGYSEAQIADFLRANEVRVSAKELTNFLGAMDENSGSGESKGRRR